MNNFNQVPSTPRQGPSTLSRRDFLKLIAEAGAAVAVSAVVPSVLQASPVSAAEAGEEAVTEIYLGINIEGPANFVADMKSALDLLASSVYTTPQEWMANIGVVNFIVYAPDEDFTHATETINILDDTDSVSADDKIWKIVMNSYIYNFYTHDPVYHRLWLAAVLSHEAKHLSLHREQIVLRGVPASEWHANCWKGPGGELKAYTEELRVMQVLGAPIDMQNLDLEQLYKQRYEISQVNPADRDIVFCSPLES